MLRLTDQSAAAISKALSDLAAAAAADSLAGAVAVLQRGLLRLWAAGGAGRGSAGSGDEPYPA